MNSHIVLVCPQLVREPQLRVHCSALRLQIPWLDASLSILFKPLRTHDLQFNRQYLQLRNLYQPQTATFEIVLSASYSNHVFFI